MPKQHQCQNSPHTDAETAHIPMPKQHTHKDIPKDIPKDNINTNAHTENKHSFFPENFPAQLKADFEKLRKAKKAPITQSAMNGIIKEAAKANITLEDAIQICCERGWQGFNASWMNKSQPSLSTSKQSARESYYAQMNRSSGVNNEPTDITGESERIA